MEAAQLPKSRTRLIDEQVVLLLQGGGALGSYQVGIYKGMHENGIEPDWIIGTSIGAIIAAIIAGNPPETRLEKLTAFWETITLKNIFFNSFNPMNRWAENMYVIFYGLDGFFKPRPGYGTWQFSRDMKNTSHYDTGPLRNTLERFVNFDYLNSNIRLTLGAVNAMNGKMTYFDNHKQNLTIDHIMASGALPPAFPCILIDGVPYWDGGISSNSPIDKFINTLPRVNSVIFAAQLWNKKGDIPETIWDVNGRIKEIQYSSRADNHLKKEQEIHEFRRAIDILTSKLTREQLKVPEMKKIRQMGCKSQMHFIQFVAPHFTYDDYTKDINFSEIAINERMEAGLKDALTVIRKKVWQKKLMPGQGIMLHDVKNLK